MYGGLAGAVGLLAAVIFYIFALSESPGARVAVAVAIVFGTLLLVLLLTFIDAAYTLYKTGPSVSPKVRMGRDPFQGTSAALVCLLDPSDLFFHGILVSLYRVAEEGMELFIGTGSVANIQEDGNILIEVTQVSKEEEDFVQSLRQNKAEALKATRVKPYMHQQMFRPNEEQE